MWIAGSAMPLAENRELVMGAVTRSIIDFVELAEHVLVDRGMSRAGGAAHHDPVCAVKSLDHQAQGPRKPNLVARFL